MNTIENNKLIAEFMADHNFYKEELSYDSSDELLKFHTSWEWLMPVVEKIEDEGVEIVITNAECTVSHDKYYNEVFDETRFFAIYNAVVEFIKWHNENK